MNAYIRKHKSINCFLLSPLSSICFSSDLLSSFSLHGAAPHTFSLFIWSICFENHRYHRLNYASDACWRASGGIRKKNKNTIICYLSLSPTHDQLRRGRVKCVHSFSVSFMHIARCTTPLAELWHMALPVKWHEPIQRSAHGISKCSH